MKYGILSHNYRMSIKNMMISPYVGCIKAFTCINLYLDKSPKTIKNRAEVVAAASNYRIYMHGRH